jgi:hypothetical protein
LIIVRPVPVVKRHFNIGHIEAHWVRCSGAPSKRRVDGSEWSIDLFLFKPAESVIWVVYVGC